ncbi:uncharacterized protein LOC130695034 [Daphnia carinata]|uniref:uncharacterized protein LOC130695034 n=1 Tax=Daphnia carinata TaxID=120202 RepID=UPI0025808FD3|nr:uncharacterized protein LOC130695034 [Daphnia carinata]
MAYNKIKWITAIALIAVATQISIVACGSRGPCDGLRLDRHATDEFMTARKCISLFGTCCSTELDLDHYNEDPRTMKSTDECYTCYNSNISVKCTGKLVKFENGLKAESCTELGGKCCDTTSKGGSAFSAIDFPTNHGVRGCDYCYSGNPQVNG